MGTEPSKVRGLALALHTDFREPMEEAVIEGYRAVSRVQKPEWSIHHYDST